MLAFPYVRFSSKKQEKGSSRERQLELCEAMISREGWTAGKPIEDLGTSAWTGEHLTAGNLGKFAQRVRAGEIPKGSILVVEKLDRLSRQEPRITQRWLEDMAALGLRIATVDGGRIYDDASLRANLMETFEILMRAKLAHDESQQKSERVRHRIRLNMEAAQKTGRIITAKTPGWLRVKADRSGFLVIKERAEIVRRVYQSAADGKGPGWICGELNDAGIPAWGKWRDGKAPTWSLVTVATLLRNPATEGDYVPGANNPGRLSKSQFRERIVGYFPRIVDADLVARARAAMAQRATGPRSGGRYTREVQNLFAGVAICNACGTKLHLRNNGEKPPRRSFQCPNAARHRGCDQYQMFRYAPFERGALDAILHLALDDNYFAVPERVSALNVRAAELAKELTDRREQAKRLVKVIARVDDAPEIEAELAEVRGLIRQAESQLEAANTELEAARGAVSPHEHLERVREVRDALNDPQRETRLQARLRVQQAIKGLGVQVVAQVTTDGARRLHLHVLRIGDRAALAVTFDNEGNKIAGFDYVKIARWLKSEGGQTPAQTLAHIVAGRDHPDLEGYADRAESLVRRHAKRQDS